MDDDKQIKGEQLEGAEQPTAGAENTRRKLVAKLAAGAFAIPTVLASISAQAAPAGSTP